jgi:hypothetical protein
MGMGVAPDRTDSSIRVLDYRIKYWKALMRYLGKNAVPNNNRMENQN